MESTTTQRLQRIQAEIDAHEAQGRYGWQMIATDDRAFFRANTTDDQSVLSNLRIA